MIRLNPNKEYNFLLVHCAEYRDGVGSILSIPCIEILKRHFKHSKIYFLAHSSMKDFFINNPFLEHVFFIDDVNLRKKLRENKIHVAISLFPDKVSTIALFRANIKTRIGIFSKFHSLLFNYKIKQKRTQSDKHEILYNISLLKPLGCDEASFPKIYLNIHEKQVAQQYVNTIFNDSTYIAICPSSAMQGIHFGWSIKNFFHLANELCRDYNVLILATKEELDSYKDILKNYENISENNIFDSQKIDISCDYKRKMIATLSCASLCIANNHVLLHSANAFDIPTISFFPYTKYINPMRYAPLSSKHIHKILTPYGIFNPKDSNNHSYIDAQDSMRLANITPQLVLDIIKGLQ